MTKLGSLACLLLAAGCLRGLAAPAADDYRLPLSRSPFGFVRHWLVCGPFPAPETGTPHAGLARDYLDGEASVRPRPGQGQMLTDGTRLAWQDVTAANDVIDLHGLFPQRPVQAVAYAYTRIFRPRAVNASLALGSDDGARVWVNGRLVFDQPVERPLRPDQDTLGVPLQAGMNEVLVKVEQIAGGWGFTLRVFDPPRPVLVDRRGNHTEALTLTLSYYDAGDGGLLVALPVCARGAAKLALPAAVQVVAPGGAVVAERAVRCGDRARFDVTPWLDGPYEVRCRVPVDERLTLYNHALWYRGNPLAGAREVAATAPPASDRTEAGLVHRLLADYLKDRLGPGLRGLPEDARQGVFAAVMEYRELLLRAGGGEGPDRAGGFVRLAWVDDIDNSPQFARVYLPPDYEPGRRWPLIVNLHGKSESNPDYLHWGDPVRRFDKLAERGNAIVVYPHGRGNSFYQGIGELDVLRALALAKSRFTVDEDGVTLMGYSMGGAGSWHVGTHHPELFAALAPFYGGREFRVTMSARALAQLTPAQRYRVERMKSSFANAESLLNVPVLVNHGTADRTVPIGISRYGVGLLQRWGYDATLWEHPDREHGDALNCEDSVVAWLLAHRRDPAPRLVRLRAADLRTASAYWVRVAQRESPVAFMRLEAEVTAPNTIRLLTDNVRRVILAPPAPLADPAKPLRVRWNGEPAQVVTLLDGCVTVSAPGDAPAAGEKTAGVEGPFSDLFLTPFAIVQGTTAADPEMARAVAQAARDLARRWSDDQHVAPRQFLDTGIGDEEAARYSLLLVGGPDENALARRLADRLPLQVGPEAITIDGRVFPARNAAVQLIYPSPLNPARYVAVLAATSAAGMKNRAALNGDVDFSIADGRAQPALVNGYFDSRWRLRAGWLEPGVAP